MAEVSIIMPCHNGAKTIQKAIESVLSQTFKDWELIVVDDFSTDGSVAVVEKLASLDSRIKSIKNTRTTHMPATPRNVGIKAASGRFIAFLDCDDAWACSKLERQLPLFGNPKCAVVFSFYKKMDSNGAVHDGVVTSPVFVGFKQLLDGNCIGNLTGIYDTAKVGKVFQKEIHHEDYLMWLEILRKGFIARNTCTVEAFYRENPQSVSGSKFKALSWTWNIYRRELGLGVISSSVHFVKYAVKGLCKKLR